MKEARDFAEFITDLRGGMFHQELSSAMIEITEAAMKTGKVGSLQITIKVKPQGEGQAEVIDAIKKTIPEPAKPATFCFVDHNSNLVRTDPRQTRLEDLRVIDVNTGELKEINKK